MAELLADERLVITTVEKQVIMARNKNDSDVVSHDYQNSDMNRASKISKMTYKQALLRGENK